MRTEARCPKCSGTTLYVCDVRQPEQENANCIIPLFVATAETDGVALGAPHGTRKRAPVGELEAWVCAGCSYTEWYTKDPKGTLAKLAGIPGSGVRVVRGAPSGSYR